MCPHGGGIELPPLSLWSVVSESTKAADTGIAAVNVSTVRSTE